MPYPTGVIKITGHRCTLDDLAEYAPPIYKQPPQPGWATHALTDIKEGERNSTLYRLACRYLKKGIPPEEVELLLRAKAHDVGIDDKEFDTLFASARGFVVPPEGAGQPESGPGHGVQNGSTEQQGGSTIGRNGSTNPLGWPLKRFLLYDMGDPAWICEPFISPGDIMFMTSDAGVGKTWLLLSLCLSIATGQQWLGRFKTRPTPTLYCDFDNHRRGDALRRRLIKLATAMGLEKPYSDLPENSLTILTRHDLPNAFNLYKKEGLDVLKANILKVEYGLVVVDTFVSVHGCQNENDAAQMGAAINNLRALASDTNAAFLISHHSRKPGANSDDSESRVSYRGSTAIKGGADCMIELSAEKAGILRVRHTKHRHIEQIKDFAVSIKDTGDGGTEVTAEDESQLTAGKKELAKSWLMFDLWKLDSLPLESGGYLSQKTIAERAQKLGMASHNLTRECLRELEAGGKMECQTGQQLGIQGPGKYWRKRKDGGIFEDQGLPFEP